MAKDDKEIVSALRALAAERMGSQRFELWLGAHAQWSMHAGTLTISTSQRFLFDGIRVHCLPVLIPLGAEMSPPISVQLVHSTVSNTASPQASANAISGPTNSGPTHLPERVLVESVALADPVHPNGLQPEKVEQTAGPLFQPAEMPVLLPEQSLPAAPVTPFPGFVMCAQNHTAVACMAALAGGSPLTSPHVIEGTSGTGKTHLLAAVCQRVRAQRQGTRVISMTAEQFTTLFVDALNGGGMPLFRRKCRTVDVLIMDDIQFLAGKEATARELFVIIDLLAREGKHVVVTTDRALEDLDLPRELVTRLMGGTVCKMQPLGKPARLELLTQLVAKEQLAVSPDAMAWIADRLSGSGWEIRGAINRLKLHGMVSPGLIDQKAAEQILSDLICPAAPLVRLDEIEKATCRLFGLDPQALKSKEKSGATSHPRMLAMWLSGKYTRAPLKEVGQYFGGRSHSTVIAARKSVEDWLASGRVLRLASQHVSTREVVRRIEDALSSRRAVS